MTTLGQVAIEIEGDASKFNADAEALAGQLRATFDEAGAAAEGFGTSLDSIASQYTNTLRALGQNEIADELAKAIAPGTELRATLEALEAQGADLGPFFQGMSSEISKGMVQSTESTRILGTQLFTTQAVAQRLAATLRTTFLVTPAIGALTAAAGFLVGKFQEMWTATERQRQAEDDLRHSSLSLAEALWETAGAVDANILKRQALSLIEEGVLDLADELGVSLEAVTRASLGEAEAMDEVTASMREHLDNLFVLNATAAGTANVLDASKQSSTGLSVEQFKLALTAGQLAEALNLESSESDRARRSAQQLEAVVGPAAETTRKASQDIADGAGLIAPAWQGAAYGVGTAVNDMTRYLQTMVNNAWAASSEAAQAAKAMQQAYSNPNLLSAIAREGLTLEQVFVNVRKGQQLVEEAKRAAASSGGGGRRGGGGGGAAGAAAQREAKLTEKAYRALARELTRGLTPAIRELNREMVESALEPEVARMRQLKRAAREAVQEITRGYSEDIAKALDRDDLTAKQRRRLRDTQKVLDEQSKALERLAVSRAKNADKLERARNRLEDALTARKDFRAKVRDSILAYGSILNAETRIDDAAVRDAEKRVNELQGLLDKHLGIVETFGTEAQRLRELGLSDEFLQEVLGQHLETAKGIEGKLASAQADVAKAQADLEKGLTASDITGQMRDRLRAAQAFEADLETLRKRGLDDTLLEDFVRQGVDSAGEIARALAAGGKDAVAEANRLQAQLERLAKSSGKKWSSEFYDAGVEAAEGIVSGLEKSEKKLRKQFEKLAKSMVATVKKELGIKSPSTVFEHEVGDMVVAGLNKSLLEAAGVEAAAAKLAAAAVPAPPAMGGFGGVGGVGGFTTGVSPAGASGPPMRVNITIEVKAGATEADADRVGRAVRRELEGLATMAQTRRKA